MDFSPALSKEGARLFSLAIWCLGKDIMQSGNLLVRYGLVREPKRQRLHGTSAYHAVTSTGARLTFWGFGATVSWAGEPLAVFMDRDDFAPKLFDWGRAFWPVFQRAGLGNLWQPSLEAEKTVVQNAVVAMAQWMANYERWIAEVVGESYRDATIAERKKGPRVDARLLPSLWLNFAGASNGDCDNRQPVASLHTEVHPN